MLCAACLRDLILSLVAEGRTVVLSSHLLDEVELTCDAVAIVDRGSIIAQGAISEMLAGAPVTLQVECTEPGRARALLAGTNLGARIGAAPTAQGLEIRLPAGTGRDIVAEINRVLVAGGITVYRLEPVQTSLESWFLRMATFRQAPGATVRPPGRCQRSPRPSGVRQAGSRGQDRAPGLFRL